MQPFVDGVQRQFETVRHAQFVEDVVQMVLHRLLADEHLLGHFLVLVALRHECDDFTLALAERRPFPSFALSAGGHVHGQAIGRLGYRGAP